jgi:hypothetical protein
MTADGRLFGFDIWDWSMFLGGSPTSERDMDFITLAGAVEVGNLSFLEGRPATFEFAQYIAGIELSDLGSDRTCAPRPLASSLQSSPQFLER